MKEFFNRLAALILREMNRKNQSCTQFSELCGVSRLEVGKVLNGQKNDIKISTVYKILDNSDISSIDIIGYDEEIYFKNAISNTLIEYKGKQYRLELKEI